MMQSDRSISGRIAALAVPSIITNITTPLMAVVAMAIAGHMGDSAHPSAVYISAVAVGSSLFNMLYWLFVFLRMGGSGLTARALGAGDSVECNAVLLRGMAVALFFGLLIVALIVPLADLTLHFMNPEPYTAALARRYMLICGWGAPAVLCTYVYTGWFLGMQNSRSPMWVSVIINLVNISLSYVVVFVFGLKVEGVALATLAAQWVGLAVCVAVCCHRYRLVMMPWRSILRWEDLKLFCSVNGDILLRTLCLVAVTLWFTRVGARQGDVMLAVNTLLIQLFVTFSYFMDGFAFAGESLSGLYSGARDAVRLRQTVRQLFVCTGVVALLFTGIYLTAGDFILGLLSDDRQVVSTGHEYLMWAATVPVFGFVAFTYDSICIGTMRTRSMLLSGFSASVLFFMLYLLLFPRLGNHGLWIAFLAYLAMRGLTLWLLLVRKSIYDFGGTGIKKE